MLASALAEITSEAACPAAGPVTRSALAACTAGISSAIVAPSRT